MYQGKNNLNKFRGKFRVKSTRLPGWDYSSPGFYFITICTKDRRSHFGKIINAAVHLSQVGNIVYEEWLKTNQIRPNVSFDEFVIMPNHLHGILILNDSTVETTRRGVSTWKPNTLGSIINQFKSKCTKRIRAMGYQDFAWQPRYYDHIIRDERSLTKIRRYIRENPANWACDQYHPK